VDTSEIFQRHGSAREPLPGRIHWLWRAPLPLGLRVRMVMQPRAAGKGRARGPSLLLYFGQS